MSALRALSSVSAAIENDRDIANFRDQKVHDIVSFSSILFEAELEWGSFLACQNQLFELYLLVRRPS